MALIYSEKVAWLISNQFLALPECLILLLPVFPQFLSFSPVLLQSEKENNQVMQHFKSYREAKFSKNGKFLVIRYWNDRYDVIRLENNTKVGEFAKEQKVSFSESEKFLLVTYKQYVTEPNAYYPGDFADLINLENNELIKIENYTSIAFKNNEKLLLVTYKKKPAELIDLETNKTIRNFKDSDILGSYEFSKNGKYSTWKY